jgi:glutamate--cysteine ligase
LQTQNSNQQTNHFHGHRLIVAASPPTEDVVATYPLIKHDLIDYPASGCKTKDNWRIGTEHEKFGFELGSMHI